MKITGEAIRWILAACIAQIAVGCIIFPPKIHYNSYLEPTETSGNGSPYRVENDGSRYVSEGLRIDVKFMTDAELNALLPEDSHRGEYSTNPYTYGDYIDRDVGYTPNRFTVFKVSVFNQTFAKVQLYPLKGILLTDQGQTLHS